ncbi:hypothetical protein P4O66_004454 [Electrophorus voltai]|uniref:Uncharacterized protein n=1 Tax=Electrophorus voltai TaxID=2609070 RepID=A0AAD8ZMI6_9TELE|nr:hypothetical protein P4O66_004454 [Electrophorus voltai]
MPDLDTGAGTQWNEPVLVDAFLGGLRGELWAELSCKQEVATLIVNPYSSSHHHLIIFCKRDINISAMGAHSTSGTSSSSRRTNAAGWHQGSSQFKMPEDTGSRGVQFTMSGAAGKGQHHHESQVMTPSLTARWKESTKSWVHCQDFPPFETPPHSLPELEKPPPAKLVKGDFHQASQTSTQLTNGGLAGIPASFPGLFHNTLCSFVHVPVPITVPIPVILNVPVALSSIVSIPVPFSVFIPVSVIVLVPVFMPSVLLVLACVGSLGPPALSFAIGLEARAQ